MMKIIFLVLSLILAGQLRAEPVETDPFSQGNQAFAEGRYADAVTAYQAVIVAQGYSAPVLFNLGNAYDRAGKIGAALASYERARLLAPRDPAVAANEALVRRQTGLNADRTVWQQAAGLLSPDLWAWLLTGAILVGSGLAFWLYAGAGRGRDWGQFGLILAVVTALLSIGALTVWNGERHRAWVTAAETPVRLSPFDDAQTSFTLADGAEVRIEGHHDDYFLIRDAKGESGWLRKDQAAALIP